MKKKPLITLAMMETLLGEVISTKGERRRINLQNQIKHKKPTGDLNKKCLGCGHKNKKCVCK